MNAKMQKLHNIVIIALFFLFLGGFAVAGILLPDKEISESERRNLATLPEYSSEAGFSAYVGEMDGYLTDQFPLREVFRHVKAGFAAYLLMQTDVNGYSVKNGSEFEQIYPTNTVNHEKNAEIFAQIAEKHYPSSKVYYSIVYDKGYYAEKGLGLDYDDLINRYRSAMPKSATYVDLSDALTFEDFYNTDIHWKQNHLDEPLRRLSQAMGFARFSPDELTAAELGDFRGVLYGQAALPVKRDSMVYLTSEALSGCTVRTMNDMGVMEDGAIYATDAFRDSDDQYDLFLGGESAIIEITNPNADSDRTLIVYRDSFGRSIAPLMAKSYQKIVLIDLRWINSAVYDPIISSYAKGDENTDVLFLYSAQVLNSYNYGY